MTFGRHWIAAAVCVPLLGLGGCSEDPEPIIDPPVETSSAADPTPTPEAKEPWEKKTDAGAVAFAEHWIEVFNEAQRTGDVKTMRALSSATCGSCRSFVEAISELYSGGGSLESKGWTVLQSVPTEGVPEGKANVALRIQQSPQKVRNSDGSVDTYEGGRETYSARLTWRASAWLMNDLVLLR